MTADHTPFVSSSLQQFQEHNAIWKVCNFHKNNYLFAANWWFFNKSVDEVGLENYQECLKQGAMIFTSHKHDYSRTHEIDAMSTDTVSVSRRVPPGSGSD